MAEGVEFHTARGLPFTYKIKTNAAGEKLGEVTIQTSFRYRNCYPAVIAAISSGRFDVKSMVTATYDYKDVQQAFEDSVNKKAEIIKSVIHMPEE